VPAPAQLLDLFAAASSAIIDALSSSEGFAGGLGRDGGVRSGQYALDLVADDAGVAALVGGGVGVLSEESGFHHQERAVIVVLDPIDGSTNAAHGIPWCGPSLCAVDDHGPLAAMVTNLHTGRRWTAVRGEGAQVDGRPVEPSGVVDLADAIVAINDLPPQGRRGWRQCRALGASALDLCAVGSGTFDAFCDLSATGSAPWDYLGGLLVCREAGLRVVARDESEPVVLEHDARRHIIAGPAPLVDEILAARWWASA
jgi:myo-inositol-1(or 4)-monophosphatase